MNKPIIKIGFLFLSLSFLLISCSPTLHIKELDETGKLPTSTTLSANEIIMDKQCDIKKYNQFLLIRKSGANSEKYEAYVSETLRNIGGFNNYYNQYALERYVVENNLAEKVRSVSDNIGLANLQKQVGDFLVCETHVEYYGSYSYSFGITIIDPSNSEILLQIKHRAFNWGGLDRPLFNPVFNYYIDWLKKNKK